MNIFIYRSYVEVLRSYLKRHERQVGIKTELATAAGCRLSYLSHVLSETAQFTMDHAFGAASFMNLDPVEHEVFLLLVQQARAASKEYRDHLQKRIDELKVENFKIEKEIGSRAELSPQEYETYASDWLLQSIHIYLTIRKYQNFETLREKLSLSAEHLREKLEKLSKMKLAQYIPKSKTWISLQRDMHAPLGSSVAVNRHLQWKMQSIQNMQRRDSSAVHFGATVSISHEDFDKIKSDIFSFIQAARERAIQSAEERVAHLDLSFFEVE